MRYISTRDKERRSYSLRDAVWMGLAPDGGLFVPERIPQVDMSVVMEKAERSFADLACYLAALFLDGEVEEQKWREAVKAVFDFPVVLKCLGNERYTLELFHGPTFAFKDFGAGFMGRILGLLNDRDEELIILTATSGDTGSAVARGFYGVPGIRVVILYPDGKVSPLQECQMTTLGKNIFPLKVRGTFDDCQRLVKMVFNDSEFRRQKRVTSANSINLLRWLPQSFYYFYGVCLWSQATGRSCPEVVVPSGNYGNLTAGMLARRMGLPIMRFVAASNANDVIPHFLQTGRFEPRSSVQTIANAMDVGNPSNYERMQWLCQHDFQKVIGELKGYACDDEAIRKAMAEMAREYSYVSDPHSAVGYLAAKHYQIDGFWLSTAHEAKFGEVVREILGEALPLPDGLQQCLQKEKHFEFMEVDVQALKERLLNLPVLFSEK